MRVDPERTPLAQHYGCVSHLSATGQANCRLQGTIPTELGSLPQLASIKAVLDQLQEFGVFDLNIVMERETAAQMFPDAIFVRGMMLTSMKK